jgi:CBS domain-containing protein
MLKAKDIMVQDYSIIRPTTRVREAACLIFQGKARKETGYKPYGIMVVDEKGRLAGMISMTDILYHVRPPFMKHQVGGGSLWEEEMDFHLEEFNDLLVQDIMSTPVLTAHPDEPIMVLVNKMVKNRVRRLPVEDGDTLLGIVYLSDLYYHTYKIWLEEGTTCDLGR